MSRPGPAYPDWGEVLTAREALESAENSLAEELDRLKNASLTDATNSAFERRRMKVELLQRVYNDKRDLYFAGERSRHDDAILAGAQKAEDLAKANNDLAKTSLDLARQESVAGTTRDLLNWLVGFFVLVSAIGTAVQAWASWRQSEFAREANGITRDTARQQQLRDSEANAKSQSLPAPPEPAAAPAGSETTHQR